MEWTGCTKFSFLYPYAKPGYQYVMGELVRNRFSTKPEEIWPLVWKSMSDSAKAKAIKAWDINRPLRNAARVKRGLTIPVPASEKKEY